MTWQQEIEVARFFVVNVWELRKIPARYIEEALIFIKAKRRPQ